MEQDNKTKEIQEVRKLLTAAMLCLEEEHHRAAFIFVARCLEKVKGLDRDKRTTFHPIRIF